MAAGLTLRLQDVDGPDVELPDLVRDRSAVVVFVHSGCPTSLLALRRLPDEPATAVLVIAQDTLPDAARLARRAGLRARMLVDPAPHPHSRAWDLRTVPTEGR